MYTVFAMSRGIPFAIGEYYHLYNRGTEKRDIFLNTRDYERFQKSLYLMNGTKNIIFRELTEKDHYAINVGERLVSIGCYCLIPNHFHILVREKTEGGISQFMKKVGTAYSMYFNILNKRNGGLFQGKFKAKHINKDEYLNYLYAYIHLNPVKLLEPRWKEFGIKNFQKAKKYLQNFPFSSYQDYFESVNRPEDSILEREAFPEYFEDSTFDALIENWLLYKNT